MSHLGYHTVLVLGGAGSGAADYARSLLSGTAAVRELDPDAPAAQIAAADPAEALLLADLAGWLAGVLAAAAGPLGPGWSAQDALEPVADLVAAVRAAPARLVLASTEVGLGGAADGTRHRAFTDALGAANRMLAEAVDAVVLVVAGQPCWLKPAVPARARAGTGRTGAVPAAGPPAGGGATDDVRIGPGLAVPVPDQASTDTALSRVAALDVPGVGLGSLARLVGLAAGALGTARPEPFAAVQVLLVYGGHGGELAAGDGEAVWSERLRRLRAGAGALAELAARAGAAVTVVDPAEVAGPVETADACEADAVADGLRYGWELAQRAVDAGSELLVLAAGGPGQDAAAALVTAVLTSTEVPRVLGPVVAADGRIDDNAWMRRCAAARDARYRLRRRDLAAPGSVREPVSLLAAVGGYDLAVATGLVLGAGYRRTPVVVDGPVGVAAGLLAHEYAPAVRRWLLLAEQGRDPAVRAGARVLGLTPVTELGLALGEGTGALAVLPLLQNALLVSTMDAVPAGTVSAAPER